MPELIHYQKKTGNGMRAAYVADVEGEDFDAIDAVVKRALGLEHAEEMDTRKIESIPTSYYVEGDTARIYHGPSDIHTTTWSAEISKEDNTVVISYNSLLRFPKDELIAVIELSINNELSPKGLPPKPSERDKIPKNYLSTF